MQSAKVSYVLQLLALVNLLAGSSNGFVLELKFEQVGTLKFFGSVEGKSYYGDMNETMTWKQARAFCKSANMEQASVDSVAEAELLNTLLSTEYITSFWTSAREDRESTGFVWDNNGIKPNTDFTGDWARTALSGDFSQCAYVYSSTGKRIVIQGLSCMYTLHALCESRN